MKRRAALIFGAAALAACATGAGIEGPSVPVETPDDSLSPEDRERLEVIAASTLVAFRQGVDAERELSAAIGIPSYSLEQYQTAFNRAVDKVMQGGNPFANDFWKGMFEKATPTPAGPIADVMEGKIG